MLKNYCRKYSIILTGIIFKHYFSHFRHKKKWHRCAVSRLVMQWEILANLWSLAPKTQLWPKSETSWPFSWLDGGSWLLQTPPPLPPAPEMQSGEQGAAVDTWLFCHQHTKTFFSPTAKHLKQQTLISASLIWIY